MEKQQTLLSRLFWFGVGGGLSVVLNIGPFHWMQTHTALSHAAALAISLTCVTILFSIWNYFLNFRTQRGFRECQTRYLLAVAFCYALTYTIALTGIKQWAGENHWYADIIVGCAQVLVAGVKFFLYHHWVYPRGKLRT
jgi:uncharacterized membrane protein